MADHKRRDKKPVSWGKWALMALGVLALLLVVVYFVATSSFFLRKVILPKASAALNAEVTVADASISPFSQVELNGLQVRTTGTEPLLTAQEVRLRYSLLDILKGNINVEEVTVVSPVVHIVTELDGSSNLDPLLQGEETKEDETSSTDEPTKLDIKNVALKNGIVRQTEKLEGGGAKVTELQDLNVTLDRFGNGLSGHLKIDGALTMAKRGGATNDHLKAAISGGYEISMTADLLPQSAKGALTVQVAEGQGAYSEAKNLTTSLDADWTPTEIREVALRFNKAGQDLGRVRVTGPFDAEKLEGNLKIEVIGIDKNLLEIATAGGGMGFGDSRLNFVNQVVISQEATFFAVEGSLMGRQISVTQAEMKTPEMNLNLSYKASANLREETAVLQDLNLSAQQNGQEFLRATLDRQMNLSWGTTVRGYRDASLNLILTNFSLANWRPVIGTNVTSGLVNMRMGVASQQDGKLLTTEIAGQLANLNARFGTNEIANATVTFGANGTVEEMKAVNFSKYNFTIQQNASTVLEANGAARYSLETSDISAQLTGEGALPGLLALAQVGGIEAQTGTLKVSANFADSKGKQTATGNVALERFTGSMDEYQFNNFQVALEYTVAMEGDVADIQRAAATFSQGFNAGGSVDLKGRYDLANETGSITYKIVNLNENTFRPFLAPSLGEKELVSIAMNGEGKAEADAAGGAAIQTTLNISNWQVEQNGTRGEPLSVGLKLNAGMKDEVLSLRETAVELSPTERAKNILTLEGQIDMRTNNAGPSTLTLSSTGFDVTRYYNMFAGESTAATAPADSPAPALAGPAASDEEPEPMELPFKDFTANLKLDRVYLNEIAITNWTGRVAIKDSTIQIQPFEMSLNGGPVALAGTVDVGVPGYRYDLSFSMDNVPLEPLANSLGDTNSAGQLTGVGFINAQIKGAGTTGANLEKNLNGTASFNLTNLNYQIVGPKINRILRPIALVLRAPELTQTPINWAAGTTVISNGIVNMRQVGVQSEAFFAEIQGTIDLEPVLTNSTLQLPVDLSLRRSLAEKIRMLPANTPEDSKYAKLPRFVTIRGTIGVPETDINKLALGSQLLQTAKDLGIGNEKTEELLGTLGNIGAKLAGGKTNQPAGTNNAAGSTNASPAGTVGNLLRGFLGGNEAETNSTQTTTNNPSTNAPAKSNPLDLFRNLRKE